MLFKTTILKILEITQENFGGRVVICKLLSRSINVHKDESQQKFSS